MQINTRESYGVTIVDMVGRLDTTTSGYTREEMVRIINKVSNKIIVNLKEIEYMSSAGLRVLLQASKLLQSSQGEMKICNANEQVSETLEVSGFHSLLDVYETEKEALAAFLKEDT